MSVVQDHPLSLQIREAQLDESDAALLQDTFAPLFSEAEQWRRKAESINVTSVEDKEQMRLARETRLALKDIRVDVEKARKRLKEESLRKGKAIDGMANVIKFLIVPIEEHLEQQENFAKVQEEKAKEALKVKREQEIRQYEADPSLYALGDMAEDAYAKLLEGIQSAFMLRKEAERKAEEERAAREKAEAEERERMRIENERLRKEAEERQRQIEQERIAKEKAEAELLAKRQEEERIERERLQAEKQAAIAPDKEKLVRLSETIAAVQMPEVSSTEAKAVIAQTIELLSKASQYVKTQAISL